MNTLGLCLSGWEFNSAISKLLKQFLPGISKRRNNSQHSNLHHGNKTTTRSWELKWLIR